MLETPRPFDRIPAPTGRFLARSARVDQWPHLLHTCQRKLDRGDSASSRGSLHFSDLQCVHRALRFATAVHRGRRTLTHTNIPASSAERHQTRCAGRGKRNARQLPSRPSVDLGVANNAPAIHPHALDDGAINTQARGIGTLCRYPGENAGAISPRAVRTHTICARPSPNQRHSTFA